MKLHEVDELCPLDAGMVTRDWTNGMEWNGLGSHQRVILAKSESSLTQLRSPHFVGPVNMCDNCIL